MPRLLPVLAVSLALAGGGLAVTGCGSDDSSSSDGTSTPAPATTTPAPDATGTASGGAAADAGGTQAGATVSISMKDIAFDPKDATAAVGDKVVWTNDDEVQHNVVADSGADFSSKTFGKGGTYEYTPTKPGKIAYECTLHPGMVGTLNVVANK